MIERPLAGGMGNRGAVVRVGDTVRRPANEHVTAVSALLAHLAASQFEAPRLLGEDANGRSVYAWIDGEVPVAPFPRWSLSEQALASVARLLRRYHDAVRSFSPPSDARWSSDLADPCGGPAICHNDVCPENVVFRCGNAVALLDFDFAAPGRPIWDVAATAGMWVPLRPPVPADERSSLDRPRRLALFSHAYGLESDDHDELIEAIIERCHVGNRFVRQRAEAGEPAFVEMWRRRGGEAGARGRLSWLEEQRQAFLDVLASSKKAR